MSEFITSLVTVTKLNDMWEITRSSHCICWNPIRHVIWHMRDWIAQQPRALFRPPVITKISAQKVFYTNWFKVLLEFYQICIDIIDRWDNYNIYIWFGYWNEMILWSIGLYVNFSRIWCVKWITHSELLNNSDYFNQIIRITHKEFFINDSSLKRH